MADFFVAPPQGAFGHYLVVAPRNQLIFEFLNLTLVRILLSYNQLTNIVAVPK
jgi:hypothetical protein